MTEIRWGGCRQLVGFGAAALLLALAAGCTKRPAEQRATEPGPPPQAEPAVTEEPPEEESRPSAREAAQDIMEVPALPEPEADIFGTTGGTEEEKKIQETDDLQM